ncbi:preprotein translocase subunit SecA [endosymbiont of Pachyrhynchus infernalis]|uniref:preprotein translocase subunit SecA n=1 Tax=endosymbiont of Pachyrhynchus infernalis TaxID=1971488 RepID=UPI000DC6F3A7|nr:preprotein translocase subunit SecA [endosymbiont of Pachyrhynchus infernalis]BBA84768.1 protein translocase subunit SecA [endosymbiont of Pachyrhynchus infernalis]
MFNYFSKYINKYKNQHILNSIKKKVEIINFISKDIEKLSDKELSNKTNEFIFRLNKGKDIDSILFESFAVVKESINRIFGIKLFDVQIIGGIVLHNKCIAEMSTGEGKTLTSTLPAYFNSLYKKGVHIVTMNDYLAKRDAENNIPLFKFLGITVGINLSNSSFEEKKKSYLCDITYGTNNEYCFDYLRDNLVMNYNDKIQRSLNYAIIDEIDSILIDEARTPLIISDQNKNNSSLYLKINSLIKYLINNDIYFEKDKYFILDLKFKQITLTENGFKLIEKLMINLNYIKNENLLYLPENIILVHHFIISLKAHLLFKINIDYIIKDNKVIIVDENTGRAIEKRRWSDGLHQAIEAKENLEIQNESYNLTSITFQSYFKLYNKLSGMTGTAYSEKEEFKYIYNLDTIVIPTNKLIIRKDFPDLIFLTEKDKIKAIINDIIKCHNKNQPVLVGTISIEKSEFISNELKKIGIKHNILNAKYNEAEAEIISQAGKPGSITIATNMAGRGTDIILGGNFNNEIKNLKNKDISIINKIKNNWKLNNNIVIKSGGLHIIGTERHESRRIDNQLIGRSGRQGDPGSSKFYLSMEDQLIKMFISDKMLDLISKLDFSKLEHPWIDILIRNSQKKIENRNFNIRKQLIMYDDIYNNQRNIIYKIRDYFLSIDDIYNIVKLFIDEIINNILLKFIPINSNKKKWDIEKLNNFLIKDFNFLDLLLNNIDIYKINNDCLIRDLIYKKIIENYNNFLKYKNILSTIKSSIFIKKLDLLWREHLNNLDNLHKGIYLRSYAQKNPRQEFKLESFNLFNNMLFSWKFESLVVLNKFIFNNKSSLDENLINNIY